MVTLYSVAAGMEDSKIEDGWAGPARRRKGRLMMVLMRIAEMLI
jgi:hypothetical protein